MVDRFVVSIYYVPTITLYGANNHRPGERLLGKRIEKEDNKLIYYNPAECKA